MSSFVRRIPAMVALATAIMAFNPTSAHATLTHFWSFNGNGLDSVGTNNAVLNGNAGYNCGAGVADFGSCVLQPTATGWAQTQSPLALGSAFTIIGWQYLTNIGGNQILVAGKNPGCGNGPMGLWTTGSGAANLEGSGCTGIASASSAVSANAWHQEAITFDGTTAKIYLDAVQIASGSLSASLTSATNGLAFGAFWNGGNLASFHTNGYIQDVALYNTALTGSEIGAALAQGGNTPYGFVPEPASLVLFGAGVVALGFVRRRAVVAR
ncbi:MAG: LamG-like jellyroll fold domain-containing protein [Rhodospirillales bacterium]